MPNKLSHFWQELKRRNVFRVITVYAGAAFVVIELVDILAPSLGLPGWTLNFILILLLAGFVITVIVSWIYDIHPEGGIVKTEAAGKVKPKEVPKSSSSWKIASYISFVVIVALIVLNVLPHSGKKNILDKSIAVLPFINDSQDQENEHIINGIMEELLINLQTIKELRVPGRTSTEQYRNNPKPIPEIASEMNVAYIVEGSGQRYGDNIRLRVQLVEGATDRHIWADSYEEVIDGPEDIFRIQSEIAQSIAAELQAVITPAEMEQIEKIPTTSLSAYDYYLRGREEQIKYKVDNSNTAALDRAEQLYHNALRVDPDYARAYVGLASAYWDRHYWSTYWSENFLDSVLIYVDMALNLDDRLAEAHSLKGDYYRELGNDPIALSAYEKAIELNPNDWRAYEGASDLYMGREDLERSFEYMHTAMALNHDQDLPRLMRTLGTRYLIRGFPEKARSYFDEAFNLDGDSIAYFRTLWFVEFYVNSNYSRSIELINQIYKIDSNNADILECLGFSYELLGEYEIAQIYFEKLVERLRSLPLERHNNMHHVAYCYWKVGKLEEADYFFDLQKKRSEDAIEFNRSYAKNGGAFYDLACVYAFQGDKNKAYENLHRYLNTLNEKGNPFVGMWFGNRDPFFDSMRDETEFRQIIQEAEDKYQAEHERVRQWLEENDML